MDLDAYVVAHVGEWRRLEELTARRRLSGAESDELVERYQRVATHLSVVRTSTPDPELVAYLSSLLARVRTRSVGTRTGSWGQVVDFFAHRFPAALYRLRRWWIGTWIANAAVTAVMVLWLLAHPQVEQTMFSDRQVDRLVDQQVEGYYSQYAATHFATQVWVNNAWVTALCLALGVLGLPVVYLLFQNVLNLAVLASLMTRHGQGGHFWGLVLPHGMLELTAVFVAGGVGLRLFWSWVEPGQLSRTRSLAQEGRTAATVALGLVAVLAVSGVIEAFVTPSPLPTWARIGIGAVAELLFLVYVFVVGRRAVAAGHTGDLRGDLLEDRLATRG